jgi:hypothetical protein
MKSVNCEALVIGGGVAGVSAAVASARRGVKTILVEKDPFLGGTAYAGMFQYICGLYLNGDIFPEDTLNDGFAREISSHIKQLSPDSRIKKIGQVYLLPYSPDCLQKVLSTLCECENNLTILRNSAAVGVDRINNEITAAYIETPAGDTEIRMAALIDCSGDGDFSSMAGADFEYSPPDKRQLAGYTVFLKGLKSCDEVLSIKVPWHLANAVTRRALPHMLRFTTFSPGATPQEGYCKLNIDGESSLERDSMAEIYSQEMLEYLAGAIPAFKNAVIAGRSLRTLNREGKRICCEYTLTEEDILSARKFHDGIVKNAWPIELWYGTRGPVYKYLRRGEYYEIPFRCLMVKGISNLLVAGRCISATHAALGSTRVIGTCLALGEKAGIAAASLVRTGGYPELSF